MFAATGTNIKGRRCGPSVFNYSSRSYYGGVDDPSGGPEHHSARADREYAFRGLFFLARSNA